jgi:hypothetical protein
MPLEFNISTGYIGPAQVNIKFSRQYGVLIPAPNLIGINQNVQRINMRIDERILSFNYEAPVAHWADPSQEAGSRLVDKEFPEFYGTIL